jgi:chromosome segregation ATPase
MRSEIEDIKELLDKKQKQLNNTEQRLKLIEMDLQSREKNIIQTAELKITENLAEKLKKFENDSKIILKRMKGMHDNLRQKTNTFKDLKETYIKNWTKDATSSLKQRNVTLEKMNEIHKQRIKTLEYKENESKTENEKLKSKIADLHSTISIMKNQLKS